MIFFTVLAIHSLLCSSATSGQLVYYDTHESLHGYKVIVFCDDGVTGTHFDRPKFDELIEMARNQEIHCIMVKDDCVIIEPTQKDLENQGFVAGSICF